MQLKKLKTTARTIFKANTVLLICLLRANGFRKIQTQILICVQQSHARIRTYTRGETNVYYEVHIHTNTCVYFTVYLIRKYTLIYDTYMFVYSGFCIS